MKDRNYSNGCQVERDEVLQRFTITTTAAKVIVVVLGVVVVTAVSAAEATRNFDS